MVSICAEKLPKVAREQASGPSYKLTRLVCWSICIGFALIEAWSGRQFTNPDGIAYLDMSDALLKHNLHLLINPLWSPLYPSLIGIATWLLRPSAYWELPIAHLVNFAIFLGMLASFEFLLRQVICLLNVEEEQHGADSAVPLPVWTWQLLGYSLFAWSTFVFIKRSSHGYSRPMRCNLRLS